MEDKIWYLKQINILEDLTQDQVMSLGMQCSMTRYKMGEHVYLPGDSRNIYFLKVGSIKLSSQGEDGKEIINEILKAGEIFGKYLGENISGIEEATALEDVMVCYMPYDKWQGYVKIHAALNINIIKWIGFRIARLERRLETLYFKDVKTKVIELLLDLGQRMGKPVGEDKLINVKLTHEDLAKLTGVSRQGVTTTLNDLRDAGNIDYDRNRILLKAAFLEAHR
jgi:CRP-like cAMP-binding protein